jgi:hypothetical protein
MGRKGEKELRDERKVGWSETRARVDAEKERSGQQRRKIPAQKVLK